MKNNEFDTKTFERTHYIGNEEMKGAAEMTNKEFNTNGRHFSNEETNIERYAEINTTQRFIDISSCGTGYERNAGILKAQNYDDYNDNFTSFREETQYSARNNDLSDGVQYYTHNDDQNRMPAPKKKSVKSKVVAIVLAGIATAAAITAGFVSFNSFNTVNKAKTEASDSVKAANTAKLQADKAMETAKKLREEKEASDKKLEAEKKAEEQRKAEEQKKADEQKKAEDAQREADRKALEAQKAELEKRQAQIDEEQKKIDREKQEAEQKKADEKNNANTENGTNDIMNTAVIQ